MEIYFTNEPLLSSHVGSNQAKIISVREGNHPLVIDHDPKPFALDDEINDWLESQNEDDWTHRISLGDSFLEEKRVGLKAFGDHFRFRGTIKISEVIL